MGLDVGLAVPGPLSDLSEPSVWRRAAGLESDDCRIFERLISPLLRQLLGSVATDALNAQVSDNGIHDTCATLAINEDQGYSIS